LKTVEDELRRDIRLTKQISVARITNLLIPFFFQCFACIIEKREFDWGAKMVEWGGAPWALEGALPPPVI
jgi:hypothetical protein